MPDKGLAQVAWAVAQLKLKPPRPWLDALLSTAACRIQHMGLLTATSLLLCFATVGGFAANVWIGALVSRAQQQMGMGGQAASFTQLSRCDNDLQSALSQLQQEVHASGGLPTFAHALGNTVSSSGAQAHPAPGLPEQPQRLPHAEHPAGDSNVLQLPSESQMPLQREQHQHEQSSSNPQSRATAAAAAASSGCSSSTGETAPDDHVQHTTPRTYKQCTPAPSCAAGANMALPQHPSAPMIAEYVGHLRGVPGVGFHDTSTALACLN